MRLLALCVIGAMTASAATAQTISGGEAQDALFGTRGSSLAISGELSAVDQQVMRETIKLLDEQMRGPIRYYAAVAYSPDEGLLSEALQSAINYHSPESASAAAIAACNAARTAGTAPCRVAAQILPRDYQPRGFTLSYDATEEFRGAYRRARAPKAFAISNATGAWGIGGSAAEAIATCNAAARGAGDCRAVVQD
jgi:hypothetical protein